MNTRVLSFLISFELLASSALGVAIPNEYWISSDSGRSDGAGSGTLDDPYNCTGASAASTLGTYLSGRPVNSTIHLLPGTFATSGMQMKDGWRILGSGIAATVVQPTSSSTIAFWNTGTGMKRLEVADLTIDCSVVSSTSRARGIELYGKQLSVRRIKALHTGGPTGTSTAGAIALYWDGTNPSEGNIVEDCYIADMRGPLSYGITVGGSPFSGIIRNNYLDFRDLSSDASGLGGSGLENVLFEGNTVLGGPYGYWQGTAGKNVTFAYNRFLGTKYPIVLSGGSSIACNAYTFIYNKFEVDGTSGIGFYVDAGQSVNISFVGNQFTKTAGATSPYWGYLSGGTGINFIQNRIDSSMSFSKSGVSNFYMNNNTDQNGAYFTGVNQVALPNGITRRSVSASATLTTADKYIGVTTASAVTLTLPAANTCIGKEIIVVAETGSTPSITVDGNGSETINGSLTQTITSAYGTMRLMSDGSNWFKF